MSNEGDIEADRGEATEFPGTFSNTVLFSGMKAWLLFRRREKIINPITTAPITAAETIDPATAPLVELPLPGFPTTSCISEGEGGSLTTALARVVSPELCKACVKPVD